MTTEANRTTTAPNPAGTTTGARGFRWPERVPPTHDTPPGQPTPPRRALFLASAAVMAGAAMGAAAQPPEDADAALLRLLEQSDAADAAHVAACRGGDDAAADASDGQLHAVLAAMAETPAMGVTGMLVKAARLLRSLRDAGFPGAMGHTSLDADAPVGESLEADFARLAPALLACAGRAYAPPAAVAADPLVALAREAIDADEAFIALAGQSPDTATEEAERALSKRALVLAARVVETPATTTAGLRAKAEAALQFSHEGDDVGLGASLAEDVLRMTPAVRA